MAISLSGCKQLDEIKTDLAATMLGREVVHIRAGYIQKDDAHLISGVFEITDEKSFQKAFDGALGAIYQHNTYDDYFIVVYSNREDAEVGRRFSDGPDPIWYFTSSLGDFHVDGDWLHDVVSKYLQLKVGRPTAAQEVSK
jgi:hypothetical protein